LLLPVANKHRREHGKKDNDNFTYFLSKTDVYLPPQTGYGRLMIAYNSYGWRKRSDGTTGGTPIEGGHPSVTVRPMSAIFFKFGASLELVIRTPLFTEYLLPILLFFGAVFSSAHRIF
jgi:hypothetical protein